MSGVVYNVRCTVYTWMGVHLNALYVGGGVQCTPVRCTLKCIICRGWCTMYGVHLNALYVGGGVQCTPVRCTLKFIICWGWCTMYGVWCTLHTVHHWFWMYTDGHVYLMMGLHSKWNKSTWYNWVVHDAFSSFWILCSCAILIKFAVVLSWLLIVYFGLKYSMPPHFRLGLYRVFFSVLLFVYFAVFQKKINLLYIHILLLYRL